LFSKNKILTTIPIKGGTTANYFNKFFHENNILIYNHNENINLSMVIEMKQYRLSAFALFSGILILLTGCQTASNPAKETIKESNHTLNEEVRTVLTESPSVPNNELTLDTTTNSTYDVVIDFPEEKYPETAKHIQNAIAKGESPICTVDRDGADENRKQSLSGVPTKSGFDRDEWPMAMCAEGGAGADIAYITPEDNRGAGSWVGNELENYPDGTRVLFVIEGGKSETPISTKGIISSKPSTPATATSVVKVETSSNTPEVIYKNCTDARTAGASPLYVGQPGYSKHLDKDGDGVACE